MKKYIGTKIVLLEPMTRLTYNQYRGWALPDDENGADEGYLVEYTDGGTPNMPSQHAGYVSWSPKEQADNAYRETEGMPFGLATEAAKMGHKVCRIGWNGSGMFAFIEDNEDQYLTVFSGVENFKNYPKRQCWYLKTAQDDIAAWAPSGSDSLADDWMIVE